VPLLEIKYASHEGRVIIYKTLIHPVFLYVSETWMLSQNATQMIGCFEGKMLWKIFGPLQVNGTWKYSAVKNCTDMNKYRFYKGTDLVMYMHVKRLQWAEIVEWLFNSGIQKCTLVGGLRG